jgi:hypothetical protein
LGCRVSGFKVFEITKPLGLDSGRLFCFHFFKKTAYFRRRKFQKMDTERLDRTKIQVYKKGEEPDDVLYWLSRPPAERIQALEAIRKEFNDWKYGPERRFQRVYRVVKRKWG